MQLQESSVTSKEHTHTYTHTCISSEWLLRRVNVMPGISLEGLALIEKYMKMDVEINEQAQ